MRPAVPGCPLSDRLLRRALPAPTADTLHDEEETDQHENHRDDDLLRRPHTRSGWRQTVEDAACREDHPEDDDGDRALGVEEVDRVLLAGQRPSSGPAFHAACSPTRRSRASPSSCVVRHTLPWWTIGYGHSYARAMGRDKDQRLAVIVGSTVGIVMGLGIAISAALGLFGT
ncbi:hypothetical protein GCM10017712_16740 [Curtobacterium citreum]